MRVVLGVLLLNLFISQIVQSEELVILQTSDLHSHFTNRDSRFKLGGIAKVSSKIKELKSIYPNTLLLDAGDFSEGSVFYAYDGGKSTFEIMDSMGYDAIALGNHDWLAGPEALFMNLKASGFKTPILSTNIDLGGLPKEIELSKYIFPSTIKKVGNLKVGIIGVSTYQFIFDSFFSPVTINEPFFKVRWWVDYLKNQEKCDVVIALTHLGLVEDRLLAKIAGNLDLIVGGHNHYLFTKAKWEGRVPIVHVGKWGEFVGETMLHVDRRKAKFGHFRVHPIDSFVEEDPAISSKVKIAESQSLAFLGGEQNKIELDSDLLVHDYKKESVLGDWVVDQMQAATGADLAIDNPTYNTRDLNSGPVGVIDFFNLFPHIFNFKTQKTWTIKTFEVQGWILRHALKMAHRLGFYVNVSHSNVLLDRSRKPAKIIHFKIKDENIELLKTYKVAATDGILSAFDFIGSYGIPVWYSNVQDTGIEMWKFAGAKLPEAIASKTLENTLPRVISVQSDLGFWGQQRFEKLSDSEYKVTAKIANFGIQPTHNAKLKVIEFDQYGKLLGHEETHQGLDLAQCDVPSLGTREMISVTCQFKITKYYATQTKLPIKVRLVSDARDRQEHNNESDTCLDLETH